MTDAKQDLIEASKSPLESWVCDHYNELCEGLLCSDALVSKPNDMKDKAFQLQLKDKCERKQKQVCGVRSWCYILKQECRGLFHQTKPDNDEEINEDSIPTKQGVDV